MSKTRSGFHPFKYLLLPFLVVSASAWAEVQPEHKKPKPIQWKTEVETALQEMGFQASNVFVTTPVFSPFQSWGWTDRDSQSGSVRFEIKYLSTEKKPFTNVECELEVLGKEDEKGHFFVPEGFRIHSCSISIPKEHANSNYDVPYIAGGAESLSVLLAQAKSRAAFNVIEQKTAAEEAEKTEGEKAAALTKKLQENLLKRFFQIPPFKRGEDATEYLVKAIFALQPFDPAAPVSCEKAQGDFHYVPGDLSTANSLYNGEGDTVFYSKKFPLRPEFEEYFMQMPAEAQGNKLVAVQIFSDAKCEHQMDVGFSNDFSVDLSLDFKMQQAPIGEQVSRQESLHGMFQLLGIPTQSNSISYDEEDEKVAFTVFDTSLKKPLFQFEGRVRTTGDRPWEQLEVYALNGKVIAPTYEKTLAKSKAPVETKNEAKIQTPKPSEKPFANQFFEQLALLPQSMKGLSIDSAGFYAFASMQMGFGIEEAKLVGQKVCRKALTDLFSTVDQEDEYEKAESDTTYTQTRFYLSTAFQEYLSQTEGPGFLYFVATIYSDENCNRPVLYRFSRVSFADLEESYKEKINNYFKNSIPKESQK